MNELFKELNRLSKRELINILITRQVRDDVSETVDAFFHTLFGNSEAERETAASIQTYPKDQKLLSVEGGKVHKSVQCDINSYHKIGDDRRNKRGDLRQNNEDGNRDEMGIKTSTSDIYSLSQMESELKQFYESCQESHLSDREIAKICEPLTRPIRKTQFLKVLRYFAILVFAIAVIYCLSYIETVSWHLSAVGRILLIELLPFWNWPQLTTVKCMVPHLDQRSEAPLLECTFCEFIDKIDVTSSLDSETISDKFIKLHRPLILENATDSWAGFKNDADSSIIDALLDDPILSESFPCKLSTNIYIGSGKLLNVLTNVDRFDTYFLHFENCHFEAVKSFRKLFPRPSFLIPEISPIQYSWLLISHKYNVEKFKAVALREEITVIGQFVGKNVFTLIPVNCEEECSVLVVELAAGESLVFSSSWNLEYKPDSSGENVAVILETHY